MKTESHVYRIPASSSLPFASRFQNFPFKTNLFKCEDIDEVKRSESKTNKMMIWINLFNPKPSLAFTIGGSSRIERVKPLLKAWLNADMFTLQVFFKSVKGDSTAILMKNLLSIILMFLRKWQKSYFFSELLV